MTTGECILVAVIVVIAAHVAAHWADLSNLLAKRKGNLIVTVTKGSIGVDSEITGTVKVVATRPIESQRLMLSLICLNVWKANHWDANRNRHQTVNSGKEVFRREIKITGAQNYAKNESQEIEFSISTPTRQEVSDLIKRCRRRWGVISPKEEIRWKLHARLVASGLDLRKSMTPSGQPVSVPELTSCVGSDAK